MGRLLTFTAGTSLFENLKDPQKLNRPDLVELFSYEGAGAWRHVLRRAESLRDELLRYASHVAHLDLADSDKRACATAEMASLYLQRQDNPEGDDRLVLLCSDTGRGAFCALVNGMLLGRKVHYHSRPSRSFTIDGFSDQDLKFHTTLKDIRRPAVELRVVEKLDPARPDTFEDTAIPELVKTIADLHYNRPANTETILNYTGGFKAAIPTLTQAAAVAGNIKLVCLYEDAAALIQQPLVPIDLGEDAEERLLYAGKGVEHRPDPIRDYTTLGALKNGLSRTEWNFYTEAKAQVQLSSLGSALQEVLEARASQREQRQ